MTAPDASLPGGTTGNVIGTPLVVAAAPAVLLSWEVTLRTPFYSAMPTCSLRDPGTGIFYGAMTAEVHGSAEVRLSGSAVANVASDTAFELYCTREASNFDTWSATDISALALTFAL